MAKVRCSNCKYLESPIQKYPCNSCSSYNDLFEPKEEEDAKDSYKSKDV